MLPELQLIQSRSTYLRFVLQTLLGVALLWALSQISIPLEPVPVTLQTMGVMIIGLLYSYRAAIYSVSFYLVLGAAGVPVFANGSGGIHLFLGPTGGYLTGFLAAVTMMTMLRERFQKMDVFFLLFYCLVGTSIIFLFGVSWLSLFVGAKQAVVSGLLPFLLPGLFKSILVSLIVRYVKK